MRLELYQCDLCMREHRPNSFWWNNANGGSFTVCRDGINGSREWKHLCPTCRGKLCSAVDRVCDEILESIAEEADRE